MDPATIRLYLPHGDARRLRVCEVSNWSGKALAAPRTDFALLLQRPECDSSGVYVLLGADGDAPLAYIGEAEIVGDRLKQHRSKEFWNTIVVFTSKDENLTKAHVRYLESRMMVEAERCGRSRLDNRAESNARLPESDRDDMEVFLQRIRQVLPVLGVDLLTPIAATTPISGPDRSVYTKVKNAQAKGLLTDTGFVVFKGSTAVLELRPSSSEKEDFAARKRKSLLSDGSLVQNANGLLEFKKDVEFLSPSGAAAVIQGGTANGLTAWKNKDGKSLKDLESV